MNIVLVIDQYDSSNNGTTVTARRYAAQLRERGHKVTIVACGEPYEGKICVTEHKIPIFQPLIDSQGMKFATPDREAYYTAFKDADIIHFYLPFRFCREGEKIAREMNIPTVAAFHCQPENVTSSVGLAKDKLANDYLYHRFLVQFYDRFYHIHCPSAFIANELAQHGYMAKTHVISNGVADNFRPLGLAKESEKDGVFRIVMCGRLSVEKRQDLIIRAVAQSRYADRIRLVLAGKGPKEHEYRALADKLHVNLEIEFYSSSELCRLYNVSDLYVHASDAEIEGISCMEALACGMVPVISNSKLSAAWTFALDSRSVFEAGSSEDLAQKIDWWLSHPEVRNEMSPLYAKEMDGNRVSDCVARAEKMYEEAIADFKKRGYPERRRPFLSRVFSPDPEKMRNKFSENKKFIGVHIFDAAVTPLLWLIAKLGIGLKIEGKKNLRAAGGGAVTVCNHVHPLDCVSVKLAVAPRFIWFLTLEENFGIPFVEWLVKWCAGLPLAHDIHGSARLQSGISERLRRGELVQIYPEAVLVTGHRGIREFRPGAFYAAVRAGKPVVPMVMCRRDKKGGKKLRYTLKIGEPLWPDNSLSRRDAEEDLRERVRAAMQDIEAGRVEIRKARKIDIA